MVARVQHLMGDLALLEQGGQTLGLLDRDRADQQRLFALPAFLDQLDDGVVLLRRGPVDLVVVIDAHEGHVGRDLDHFEAVDVGELLGLGHGRAGHAGELRVEPEVVLEGDRGQGLVLVLDNRLLFGLQRLVQAIRVAPPFHHPAGELVDDDDLVVLDDVVRVALEQLVGAQCLVDVVHQAHVVDVVERARVEHAGLAQQLLDPLGAGLGQRDGALLLVLLEVLLVQPRDQRVGLDVKLGGILRRPRDDQRRAGLVDQDRVHLVDDRVVELALDHLLQARLHVVAQVVEAEFVVGAVGDVAGIGRAALVLGEVVDDAADGETEELVDRAHPGGVAFRQVVVDRDHVNALAGQGVQVDRQRRHQGLALAGLHLRDHAAVQHDAADQLNIEMALTEGPLGRLTHRREGFDQDVVEGFAVLQALPEGLGPRLQLLVAERLQLGLQVVDRLDHGRQALDVAVIGGTEDSLGERAEHETLSDKGDHQPPEP